MFQITYYPVLIVISILWCCLRAICAFRNKHISWKRELQLLLVYICIVVVVRFTFFPFFKADGKIQPLVFEATKAFPFRINWIPFVYLFDYPSTKEILINVIGNTTMFIPLGVVWPIVFKKLDNPVKVIAAGIGFSLCIEILQLPFFDRVSDVDDLILNSLGFIIGFLLYLLVKQIGKKLKKT